MWVGVEKMTCLWVIRGGCQLRKPYMWDWLNQEVVISCWRALCEYNERLEVALQKKKVIAHINCKGRSKHTYNRWHLKKKEGVQVTHLDVICSLSVYVWLCRARYSWVHCGGCVRMVVPCVGVSGSKSTAPPTPSMHLDLLMPCPFPVLGLGTVTQAY